jgi:hypothetical protein
MWARLVMLSSDIVWNCCTMSGCLVSSICDVSWSSMPHNSADSVDF